MTILPAGSSKSSSESNPAGPAEFEQADRFVGALTALMAVSSRAHIEPVLRELLASAHSYLDVDKVWLCGGGFDIVVGDGPQSPWHTVTVDDLTLSVTSLTNTQTARQDRAARAMLSTLGSLLYHLDVEARLQQVVNLDEITGLLNRRSMQAALHARLTEGSPGPVALLRCDIDQMAALNNVLGVDAGDHFMKVTARRLREVIGPDDIAGRVSGDQLAVVSSPSGEQQAITLAARIEQAISEPVAIRPRPNARPAGDTDAEPAGVLRTTSIGIGMGVPGHSTPEDVERFAVASVSAAKALGGATTVVYSDALRRREAVRAEVELRLPRAMSDGGLALFYQAEVDLLTTRLLGAEALVRWYHPTLGLLLPGSFIETVETSPYAVTFGNWVLDQACRQWASWLRSYPDHNDGPCRQVRVNITATQLMSVDFVATVQHTLARYRLPAQYLNLELTERDVVRDIDGAARTVRALAALGVGVAIDDFGTGYSSLVQLKNFVVNTVKVDRSFVSDIATDPGDRSIVAAIVSLAHSLGLDVVAEGVQVEAAVDVLTELGCRRGQGFLFAPPLPPEEFEPLLSAGRTGHRAG